MNKITILADSPDQEDITGHLSPIINFLIQQGNIPVTGKFTWHRGGIASFLFQMPVDVDLLKQHFEVPYSIRLGYDAYYGGGVVWDMRNAIKIHQGW